MGFFDGLMRAAGSVRSKKQSQQYRRLRAEARAAKLRREKARLLRQATKERDRARRDTKRMKPKRRFQFIGDLSKFAGRLPSDAELNQTLFGAPSPKRPKGGK